MTTFPRRDRTRPGANPFQVRLTLPAALGAAALAALSLTGPRASVAEAGPSGLSDTDALRASLRQVIGNARDEVFPALVSIRVVTAAYHGGREIKGTATGSGTIISSAGHVLTNQHVTRGGQAFVCTLSDKREVRATLVGEDPLTDLAVLALDLEAIGDDPLPVALLGDSDALETGDYVMAMGSPFSLSRSVSLGIVANTERVFAAGFGRDDLDVMELEQGQRTGLFTRWIQHDALINPGNSGGPLVNLGGEIVGVNELGGNAMGFAIPSNLARRVADALIEHGEVPRSWIGVSFRPIRRTGYDRGVLVDSVVLGSPAAEAGVAAGDVVVGLEGEAITVRFPEEVPPLLDRIASLPVGATVAMETLREGETRSIEIVTERLTKDLGDETAFLAWGLSAQEITPKMARDHRLDSTRGALVSGVRSGGPAEQAEPSLEPGDVLLAIDGEPVESLAGLITAYSAHNEAREAEEEAAEDLGIVVEVDRRGQRLVTLIEPRGGPPADPPRELPKAWIGVATQAVPSFLAEALGLGSVAGFRITRVYPKTEAADAGLAVGDVIVALDGEALEPRRTEDRGLLARRVRGLEIGAEAKLTVLRDGAARDVAVVLERTRLTPEEARSHRDDDFELTVRELTFFDRDENRWDLDLRGVLVTQASPGGWAQLGGLRSRDLILSIDGMAVQGLKSFRKAMRDLRSTKPDRVEILVLRGVRTHFQFLEPDWNPAEEDS